VSSTPEPKRLIMCLDCSDPVALAPFWCEALNYRQTPLQEPYVTLLPRRRDRPVLLLQRVPEAKSGKNRMHLDLHVEDHEAERARLEALGARTLSGEVDEHGFRWYVMADPEGNEFCVIRPPERSKYD
jgi:predicted enzyme related to lactoylglutathione lyase